MDCRITQAARFAIFVASRVDKNSIHPKRGYSNRNEIGLKRYIFALHLTGKVTIQIVESNQSFAPLTTVYPVQERNTSSTITIGHIDECHYVSITALQSNASISMCNELTNDTQASRKKHFIMSIYAVCFSRSSNHALTGILQHYRLSMSMHVCSMRSVM